MTDNNSSTPNPNQISIDGETSFIPERSNQKRSEYFFLYTITISNSSNCIIRLLSRHWIITDSNGERLEIRGEGVVGKKPYIFPGKSFRYTSGVSIKTEIGMMAGSYFMTNRYDEQDDESSSVIFEVPIPAFSIHMPNVLH